MAIPKRIRLGEIYKITMMELRSQPGEVIDAVKDGAIIQITKQGKHVASIVPVAYDSDTIVVNSDGSTNGLKPITWRQPNLLRN